MEGGLSRGFEPLDHSFLALAAFPPPKKWHEAFRLSKARLSSTQRRDASATLTAPSERPI